jgi:deoxycytidylate deaminase
MATHESRPELIIGLVAPVGVDLNQVQDILKFHLSQYQYSTRIIQLSSLIKNISGLSIKLIAEPEDKRIDSYMTAGNEARLTTNRGDIITALGIQSINVQRSNEAPISQTAHIFRSIKHPDEVQTLRNVYGDGFYLLGISSSKSCRLKYLKGKGISRKRATKLIARDESEEMKFGQHTREAFHLADCFVNIDDTNFCDQVGRFLDLIFGKPFLTPTKDEYSMFLAFASSLRSGDLSRQVGAVITSPFGEIISTGANDVPSPGGGLYWTDDGNNDFRDFKRGFDANEKQRNDIIINIMKKFEKEPLSDDELIEKGKSLFQDTRILDITEYGRAVHAEMEAIISCARSGVSPRNGTLYCTTFPCHNCAKHIVAAGLSNVVFIEPYPKSLASQLHSDAILLFNEEHLKEKDQKVVFRPFVGIGPRRYIDFFSMKLSSGYSLVRKEKGKIVDWQRNKSQVRVPLNAISYIDKEISLMAEINDFLGD